MPNEKKFYVYVHRRLTDGLIFYVGKGCGKRHLHSYGKSKWWKSITEKHGWSSQIIHSGLSEICAYSIEKILIEVNKKTICNLAAGGVGGSGFKNKSQEHIARIAALQTGRPKSDETRRKISESAKERYKDKTRHWHTTLKTSYWKNSDGREEFLNHVEMNLKFGGHLGGFKKAEGKKLKSYMGWSVGTI